MRLLSPLWRWIALAALVLPLTACASFFVQAPPAPEPRIEVVAEGLLAPIGLAALPDGSLLVAEDGTGAGDDSAGVSLIRLDGQVGRLIAGLPSGRNAGDLTGVAAVALSPAGDALYLGAFDQGRLWTLPLTAEQQAGRWALPATPLTVDDLVPAMSPLNNVRLLNPFDITFDPAGRPVVTDASGNGVARENPDGTVHFLHRFAGLPNLATPNERDVIDPVPTGIERVGEEYYITLTGGCPFPEGGGRLVAIDESRNQRTVAAGLNMPIDVAQGPDGVIWVLEFARFAPDASCFSGAGYQERTGRLSRLSPAGVLEPVLTGLNHPGAVLPMPDGSLYLSEVFNGRVLHVILEPPAAVPVEPGAWTPRLRNVAAAVGLDFRHGAFRSQIWPDPAAAMSGGLCWIDYDNDGWLDLYLVNSHAQEEAAYWQGEGGLPRNALYRNLGGQFVDVSAASGADLALRGNGCVAADFDGDGWSDLYVTADGPNTLLWNEGDGSFVEGAAAAGVAAPEWSTAAVVGDLNQDGLPDLFVAAYLDLARQIAKPSGAFPQDYYGLADRLYLNRGVEPGSAGARAVFEEVTLTAGLEREERGLGALLSDLEGDGDLDLYIANDGHPNRLYANEPWPGGRSADPQGLGFRLRDLTDTAHVGDSGSGMGVAGGDYDGDGLIDLIVTNWERELNALYRNESAAAGRLTFQYSTFRIGLMGLGNNMTGWGVAWLDLDHDTDLDLLVVNGRVPVTDLVLDRQLVRVYRNLAAESEDAGQGPARQFVEWTQQVGLEAVGPLLGRGSAVADFDNDGDLDVAINTIGSPAVLLRNEGEHGNWLQVALAGFHPGAVATVELADGRRLVRELHVGGSYLASEDPRLHFGLGDASHASRLTVVLPGGRRIELHDVAANQVLHVD